MVLITSANCVVKKDGNIVDASLVVAEFLAVDDINKGPTFSIEKIVIHPGYMDNLNSDITNKYDMALLKLQTPIVFKKKHYRPVCIPELGEEISLASGTVGITLGWNQLKTIDNKITHRLLKNPVVLQDSHYCDIHFNSSSRTICADFTDSKPGAVEADYAKAIFLPSLKGSHMMQIGIASFRISASIGINSFELEYFTKIDAFIPFINYYSNEWGAAWCLRKISFPLKAV